MLLNELFSKLDEAAGVGVVAPNKKAAKDPRYAMSMTVDIKPGETKRQAAKFGNSVDAVGRPPVANPNGKIDEAAMSVTIQGRNPISAGARGLMAAKWKYNKVVDGAESQNMDNSVAELAHRLSDIDQGLDYDSIDSTMRSICEKYQIDPHDLHVAFTARYNLIPDKYAAKMRHERKNKPKSV